MGIVEESETPHDCAVQRRCTCSVSLYGSDKEMRALISFVGTDRYLCKRRFNIVIAQLNSMHLWHAYVSHMTPLGSQINTSVFVHT